MFKPNEEGTSPICGTVLQSTHSFWLSVDPLSDKYPSTSPYLYCRNNPVILVDPNGLFDDGYQDNNGNYKWFEDHQEHCFKEGITTWTKVTDNKEDWQEATTIRNANIEGLVYLGFEREQVEKDVRLYSGDNPLFTKESQLNNAKNYIEEWESAPNSGGGKAFTSPTINNSGYSLKYYPTKNGATQSIGIVKSHRFGHLIEGGIEFVERCLFHNQADNDPLYDMHYNNAYGLLNSFAPKLNNIYNSSAIYSNYHRSGGMKLP